MSTNLFSPPNPGGTAGKQPCGSSLLLSTLGERKGERQTDDKVNNLKKGEKYCQQRSKRWTWKNDKVNRGGITYKVVKKCEWNRRENERRRSQKVWRQQLICEAWSILAVRDVLSLITEIILHVFSSTASLLAECVSAVTVVCGSVLAALSRIEELDFAHEVGDVTPRVFSW